MVFPAKVTSKGQLTIPKKVRDQLSIISGTRLDITLEEGSFRVKPKKKLSLLDLRGSLKHLDDGRPWREIREEAHRAAAAYAMKRAHRR